MDPIPLTPEATTALQAFGRAVGVVVTNLNHPRAAAEFAGTLSIPVYAHRHLRGQADIPKAIYLDDGEVFSPGLTTIAIDGGPEGELALPTIQLEAPWPSEMRSLILSPMGFNCCRQNIAETPS